MNDDGEMERSGNKTAQASLEHLRRIFTVPEAPGSTLARIEQAISDNLAGFLQEHVVAVEKDLESIEADFTDVRIPEDPLFVSEQADFLLDKVVAQSVHTAAPSFVGHMTTALPYFMLPLSKILIALNQNLVKTETSKAFTPLERQVTGMLHRLVFAREEAFYTARLHDSDTALGAFGSGGTIANLTALWVARNRAFPPDGEFPGVSRAGLAAALRHYDCNGAVILVSERGHYSLRKAADLLGLGRDQLVAIPVDARNRVRPAAVERACRDAARAGQRVLAVIGVAGTTETGNIDPLEPLAEIAATWGSHYHVDAAWGGPTLFSERYRERLSGIERADSVTLDAHKQLYVPLGCGIALFREAEALNAIEHHAAYVIRTGSKDLGSRTLEGSRPGMALLVHSGLRILGRRGYALLIDEGIEKAKRFAERIDAHPEFELVTAPELNILTYRLVPAWLQEWLAVADAAERHAVDLELNVVTRDIQRLQRAHGRSFVSRTSLMLDEGRRGPVTVFRVVLANPLTTGEILDGILEEQLALSATSPVAERLDALQRRSRGGRRRSG